MRRENQNLNEIQRAFPDRKCDLISGEWGDSGPFYNV